ncbi:MAG: DUF3794 domain-containing protein [Peptostreptococcaceae bacterium]
MNCNPCNMDLIDVSGLCSPESINFITPDPATGVPGNIYWSQMYIPETLSIPPQKPDVEEINSVNISVNIIRKQVIVTPSSGVNDNLEGKKLTGRKLIVEGELCQKVTYTACDKEQSIHSAHFYVPFSAYIVVPETVIFDTLEGPIDSLDINFQVNACVEDLIIKSFTCRHIYKNVTLLLQAVPTQNC